MSESPLIVDVKSNYTDILRRVDQSAKKSSRDASDITIVGVTKHIDFSRIKTALDVGLKVVGEVVSTDLKNKLPKITEYRPSTEIHIIGNMQSNKAKYSVENCNLIQSVRTEKILSLINKYAKKNDLVFPILLQVDISEFEYPKGLSRQETIKLLKIAENFANVEIRGIMTIAPLEFETKRDELRKFFAKTNQFFNEDIKSLLTYENPQLSMGMSNDFELAIEEGATMIRVGTAIFGYRQ